MSSGRHELRWEFFAAECALHVSRLPALGRSVRCALTEIVLIDDEVMIAKTLLRQVFEDEG